MDKIVFDANVEIEENVYLNRLSDFYSCSDRDVLFNEYKNHEMRFCLIIRREIAKKNDNIEFAEFIDSVIESMTDEISLLNKGTFNNNINSVLKKYSFHEKVNILFYVRKDFYDKDFETYEILNETTHKLLSDSIIEEANIILSNYELTLKDVININSNDLKKIIKDKELIIDLKFASELVK